MYFNNNSSIGNKFTSDYDPESSALSYKTQIRNGFIRKVYGILSIQLLITTLFTITSCTSSSFAKFQQDSLGIFILCFFLTLALPCVIVCCKSAMSKVPNNYIILFTFTFAESYLVSYICSVTDPKIVLMAAIMTFSITLALTFYAYTTKTDFTIQGGLYFVLGCGFFLLVIFGMFTNNNFIHILISVFGVCLFGLYILYDTQIIVGKHELSLEIDDYILGAFMLYVDIINLFLYILDLLKLLNSD